MGEYSKLEVLDMTDNYVGELGQIKILQQFRHLKELNFRLVGVDSKGSNPLCDLQNYPVTVKMYCLYLKTLDGVPIE
jgi:hypothetical protein